MSDDRLERLKYALAMRVDVLVPDLLPAARRNGGYWSVGSLAGEPGGSLYVHRSGPRLGKWKDAATGQHGDMLDLIQETQGGDLKAALDWADAWLGNAMVMMRARHTAIPRRVVPHDPTWDNDEIQRAIAAQEIWGRCRPAAGTVTEAYWRFRQLTGPVPPSIRHHDDLAYYVDGKVIHRGPALVAAVQAPDRSITAVHRIWLAPGGQGKAALAKPKRAHGPIGAGAIRLCQAGRTLGLTEGIENARSATQLYSLPVWSTVAGSRLHCVAIPDGVEHIVLFGDWDDLDERAELVSRKLDGTEYRRPNPMFGKRPGEEFVRKATEAYEQQGLEVSVEFPEGAKDWNEVLNRAAPGRAA